MSCHSIMFTYVYLSGIWNSDNSGVMYVIVSVPVWIGVFFPETWSQYVASMPVLLPQDAAVPMLQRLGLLGVESLPDLLGEEGKGMELEGTTTALYAVYIYVKYIHQIISLKHLEM